VAFELPRDVAIQVGDVLAFAGDPATPIAIVESFSNDDRNPVRTVEARLPVNIHQLHYLLISR
jgi:cell shape-determining protein MreC